MKLYQAIAQNARLLALADPAFIDMAEARQKRITDCFPSGSGFDAGTKLISADDSRIVFETSFHHMDENGFYDGWTEHRVTVRASLMHDFIVDVAGKNRNGIKDYIAEQFAFVLSLDFDWIKP